MECETETKTKETSVVKCIKEQYAGNRLATIHMLQSDDDDRRTQHCSISATVSTVG